MDSLHFNHRYGLAFADGQETPAELERELVTAGAEAAEYAALYGRLTTLHFRLLAATEMFLGDKLTREGLAVAVGEARRA